MLVWILTMLYFQSQPTEEQIHRGKPKKEIKKVEHINEKTGKKEIKKEEVITYVHVHAMRASKYRGRSYGLLHNLLVWSLLAVGVGMKIAAKHISSPKKYPEDVLVSGYGLVLSLACMLGLRLCHTFDNRTNKKLWGFR